MFVIIIQLMSYFYARLVGMSYKKRRKIIDRYADNRSVQIGQFLAHETGFS